MDFDFLLTVFARSRYLIYIYSVNEFPEEAVRYALFTY